jgi:CheY-like chemotaxis protein
LSSTPIASRHAGPPSALILWAEDDMQDRQLIRAALDGEPKGVTVTFVEDGVQLLAAVARHLPDLVVLDLKMPRMGGLQALRTLRADQATRDLRVVVFSSGSLPEEIEQCRQLGVIDVVQKPIEFGAFAAAVEALVRLPVAA